MYRKLDDGNDRVLAYRLTGTVTESDVKEIKKDLDSAIDVHGKVRVLVDLADFSGAEPGAVWEDLKAMPTYVRDVERVAVLGDSRWNEWMAQLADTLSIADAEYFEPTRPDDAWAWIRS